MRIIELSNVTKRIKGRFIINNASFGLNQGEICGFVGPNGSGKTTLTRILTGLIKPNSGMIKIHDEDVFTNKKMALQHVGAIVETPVFFPYMSGRKNLKNLGRLNSNILDKELDAKIEDVLEKVGLQKRGNDKVGTYSLGIKQRLGIAQALLGDPKLIILDEPTNGLDPMGIKIFREIILHLNRDQNITFFISSHGLRELDIICNSWIFINEGEIKWRGTTEELKEKKNDIEELYFELMK